MINIYRTDDQKINSLIEAEPGCWIKLTSPTKEECHRIAELYEIDEADVTAALDDEERSRITLEDGYTVILVDIPASEVRHRKLMYTTIPLGIILKQDYVFTSCAEDTQILRSFIHTKVRDFSTKKKIRFVYQILLNASILYQTDLRIIDKKRNEIEDRIGQNSEQDIDLVELHDLESTLVYFATSLRANGMVMERLQKYKRLPQYVEDVEILEDVFIEHKQAIEMTAIYRDIIDGTRELVSTMINNRLNNVMKYLTSLTLVLAIPTIISGLYGMNVDSAGMPLAHSAYGFGLICLGTVLICGMVLFWLHRKKML